MRSANIQSASGGKDSLEQDQDERTKRQREEKKTQRDYTGYPSESNRKKSRQNKTENKPGYPRSSQQQRKFKTGLFSKFHRRQN
jgi:hypothetical protein